MSMLVLEAHRHGGTWVFYAIAPVTLGGALACLWWIVRGAIPVFAKTSRSLMGLRLDVQGDEHQPFADPLGPSDAEDERAAPPIHLGDERLAVLLEAPGAREAEPGHVKAE
jgi:hypothetical protein